MRNNKRTIIQLLCVISLIFSAIFPFQGVDSYAGSHENPITVPDSEPHEGEADISAIEEASDISETSKILLNECKKLQSLTEGKDYVKTQAFFRAENRKAAKKVAEEYGARLINYERGVGVLDFGKDVETALKEAALNNKSTAPVYADLYFDVLDTVPNDPLYHMQNPSMGSASPQWHHEVISDLKAHELSRGEGVKVAVIDTGVLGTQEDLSGNLLKQGSVLGDDGADSFGHGTHCSGIILSEMNNGLGGFGVAPKAELISIKVGSGKTMKFSDVLKGIQAAIDSGANIISMSIGATGRTHFNSEYQNVINEAASRGIICIAAAGNGINGLGTDIVTYPAAYENVIAVAASTPEGALARYSNYGSWVDIVAPGSNIWSTYITPTVNSGIKPDSDRYIGISENRYYGMLSGTSQACPIAAGIAALILSENKDILNNGSLMAVKAVEELLINNTDGKTYTYENHEVKGQVRAYESVLAAKGYTLSSPYSLVDPYGFFGVAELSYISAGKSIKLKIGDGEGNTKSAAAKAAGKKAVFTSSDPLIVSVTKKGRVKCNRKAMNGDTVSIKAAIGEDVLLYQFTVRDAVKKLGYRNPQNYRYSSVYEKGISINTVLDLRNPYAVTGGNAFIIDDLKAGSEVAANSTFRYQITLSKKDLSKVEVLSRQRNGDPAVIRFTAPGKYKINYKMTDGSNKKFKLKLIVS